MDYKKAYALLAGTMSEVVDELEESGFVLLEIERAKRMLKDALERAEEAYLCSEDEK